MRVAVLTTDTTHHAYYAWRLAERGLLAGVVLETRTLTAPFETHHPFEDERDAYEHEVLLADAPAGIDGYAETRTVATVNEAAAREALAAWRADLVVSFGTGLIGGELIAATPGLLNLHGGNPEEYRGLDTHLWAIYHRDFANLVTVLHEVDVGLDTGALVGQAAVGASRTAGLHELRARNTERCVELTVAAAATQEALGALPARPQVRHGRYYSFMPSVLKDVCVRRWAEAA